jgi:carboxypeptidase Taq
VRAIAEQPPIDDGCLHGTFNEPAQLDFGLFVAKRIGYDLERGRLDKTHHPFCTTLSAGDVRITTRVDERDIGQSLFSILHEAGHALYEQGISSILEGTPLGSGASAGVHESQSRLWENMVGRDRAFWHHFLPGAAAHLSDQLGGVTVESFYRAINKVERSLIRTDADEVTYNLHIMMRFDLELDLLEGRLRVKDLPEAWRERMQADLGLVPPDDRDGCLQDVIGMGAPSAAASRATQSAIFSARSSMMPRSKQILKSRTRSWQESTARSTNGCARMSINTDASSSRTSSWNGRPAAK